MTGTAPVRYVARYRAVFSPPRLIRVKHIAAIQYPVSHRLEPEVACAVLCTTRIKIPVVIVGREALSYITCQNCDRIWRSRERHAIRLRQILASTAPTV